MALGVSGQLKNLSGPIGRLDGAYELADFCVPPNAGGLTVYLPDLVQSQLRK